MEKIFCNVNSKFISELIKDSKKRIIYVSPGINQEIFFNILEKKDKIGFDNINIIIDANSNVLRYGYGDEESTLYLEEHKSIIKTQPGLRIGFICIDDDGYIFSPTPLSLENERIDNNCPNAINIKETELERIIKSIVPQSSYDKNTIEIGKSNIKTEEIQKIKKDIESKPIIKPDLQRQINVINSVFQIVKIDFEGSKLKDKKYKIDAKELGITNVEISEKISTTYKIFKSLSLPIEIEKLEDELNFIKKKYLKQVDNVGLLLLNENYKEFIHEIDNFRKKIIDVQKNCNKKIDMVLDKSIVVLVDFIVSNLMKLPLKEKEKLISYESPTKENLKVYIENKIKRGFPKADQLLSKIELNMKIFNISDQLMMDKNFVEKIEKYFNKSFAEIANVEMALGTKQVENGLKDLLKEI